MQLAKLYAFADRVGVVRLMNDVVWELFSLPSKENFPPFLSSTLLTIMYPNTHAFES
jgi:hypothetical protein